MKHLVIILVLLLGLYYSYKIQLDFYKQIIKETIQEVVKPEYLKEGESL